MPQRAAKIHIQCPECGEKGLRFILEDKLIGQTVSVVCIKCKQVDEEIDYRDLCETISGISKKTDEDDSLSGDWLQGFLEKMLID